MNLKEKKDSLKDSVKDGTPPRTYYLSTQGVTVSDEVSVEKD